MTQPQAAQSKGYARPFVGYAKCELVRYRWSANKRTDISARAPACAEWKRKNNG